MPDYTQFLDAIYDSIGVAALLDDTAITIIDKTEGVALESANGGMVFGAAKPAVCVRVAELDDKEILRSDLDGMPLTFNDKEWRIQSTLPKPKPGSKGELYLLLRTP